jgi:hypothetical protein
VIVINTAPDVYQATMSRIFDFQEFVIVYLDDILIFSRTLDDHLNHLHQVFQRLQEYDITLNPKKCLFLCQEVDYLGFILTTQGIKPQSKKVDAILKLRFLGVIQYYRERIRNKSTLTSSLTAMTSPKVPFKWTSAHLDTFKQIKNALAKAVLLVYPDFKQPFHVYPDASGKQLGGLIMQGSNIIACFSRTLSTPQKNYTSYRHLLLGHKIIVHTDHKNLLYPTENSLRVKRWKLLLEEYQPEMHFIKGVKNIGADSFSRLSWETSVQPSNNLDELFSVEEEEFLLKGEVLKAHQKKDATLQKIMDELQTSQHDPDYRM